MRRFTFIELLVVIAIFAIALGMVWPAFKRAGSGTGRSGKEPVYHVYLISYGRVVAHYKTKARPDPTYRPEGIEFTTTSGEVVNWSGEGATYLCSEKPLPDNSFNEEKRE